MTTTSEPRTASSASPKRRTWGARRTFFAAELGGTALILLLPALIISGYQMRLVLDVAILAILALGMTLIFGYTGQISLGQAAFYAVGAYASAIVQTKLGVPAPLAWVFAIALGMIVAYAISLPLLRIHGHFLALGTLALGLIVATLLIHLIPLTGGHDGIRLPSLIHLGEFMTVRFPYIVLALLAVAYWLVRNLTARSVGRSFLALRDDPNGAAALGIPVTRYKTFAFTIGGGLAALAGVLYAHHTQVITPEVFGFDASIQVLLVVVIGGMSSRFGALIGAAIVVILPEWLQYLGEIEHLLFGLMVLAALLYLPGGIVGGISSLVARIRRRSTAAKEVSP